jgi:all-trans-retinol dehydrogenase (NAD+)
MVNGPLRSLPSAIYHLPFRCAPFTIALVSQIARATVLITGAAKGLGRRLALLAAQEGAAVVLWDIDAAALETAAGSVRQAGGRTVHTAVVDVSNREEIYAAASRLDAASVGVDILVNNAGVVSGRRLLDTSDAHIEATFAVNTLALYWTTKAFLPGMIRRGGGHIVTIASAAGLVGVARQTDYAASKHGAVGFDESLRYELRGVAPRVKTTLVCPFYIDTGMFRGVKSRFPLLLPILEEEKVARRIIRAIRRDERRLIMPSLVRLLPVMRLLPPALFDRLIDFFGVNASMDEFTGRRSAERSARPPL